MNNKIKLDLDVLYSIQLIEEFLDYKHHILIPIWYDDYNKIRDIYKDMDLLYKNLLEKLIEEKNDNVVDAFKILIKYYNSLIVILKLNDPSDIYLYQKYPEMYINLMRENPRFALEQYNYDLLALGC